jgi:hypothetical protein
VKRFVSGYNFYCRTSGYSLGCNAALKGRLYISRRQANDLPAENSPDGIEQAMDLRACLKSSCRRLSKDYEYARSRRLTICSFHPLSRSSSCASFRLS